MTRDIFILSIMFFLIYFFPILYLAKQIMKTRSKYLSAFTIFYATAGFLKYFHFLIVYVLIYLMKVEYFNEILLLNFALSIPLGLIATYWFVVFFLTLSNLKITKQFKIVFWFISFFNLLFWAYNFQSLLNPKGLNVMITFLFINVGTSTVFMSAAVLKSLFSMKKVFNKHKRQLILRLSIYYIFTPVYTYLQHYNIIYADLRDIYFYLHQIFWLIPYCLMIWDYYLKTAGNEKEHLDPLQKVSFKYELSEREVEVITHIRTGMTNKVIAEQLHISPRTVEKHVNNIYKKLKINNKVELINLIQESN